MRIITLNVNGLRAPERKREAWRDLLALRARLDALANA